MTAVWPHSRIVEWATLFCGAGGYRRGEFRFRCALAHSRARIDSPQYVQWSYCMSMMDSGLIAFVGARKYAATDGTLCIGK